MESPTPPPFKRIRTVDNVNECIREFQLLQQYPSMVSTAKSANISSLKTKPVNSNNQHWQQPISKSVVLVLHKEEHGLSKLQKSRIKSISGKDLGEVKLRPMSHNDVSKSSIVTFSGQCVNKKNKLIYQENVKCLPNFTSLSSTSSLCQDVDSQGLVDKILPNENKPQNQSDMSKMNNLCSPLTTLVTKRFLSHNEDNHAKRKSNQNQECHVVQRKFKNVKVKNTNDVKQNPYSIESVKRLVRLPINKKLTLMTKSNNVCSELYEKRNTDNMRVLEINEKPKHAIYIGNSLGKQSVILLKSAECKKVAESKFPRVKCEKLCLPVTKNNPMQHDNQDYRKQTTELSSKNVNNISSEMSTSHSFLNHKTIVKTNSSNNVVSKIKQSDNCNTTCCNDDEDVYNISNDTNRLTIANEVVQINSALNSNKIDNSKRNWQSGKINKAEIQSCAAHNSDNLVKSKLHDANNSKNLECAGDVINWSILKEAVNSVPDKELRAKALQALAACGTGSGRQIPKTSPSDMKTVHDSTMQTVVFGLLDKDSFVLVQENTPDIQRIKQVTRPSLHPALGSTSTLAQCTLLENEQFFPSNRPMETSELDELLESIIGDDEQTREINNILTYRNENQGSTQMCNKIYNQLQRDFDTFKQFDEFGLLNIHRAVMQNRLQDVDRHIMVLQARRESVDILTQDGMTSLELAISYDVHPEIVQALLKAGAQPARANPSHDSALVIASKLCSSILKELVNYVSSNGPLKRSEQLDQLDSTGFAALHYCAQKGNKEGVSVLLRAGANANLQDGRSGRTALFHAVENEYSDVVRELLNHGASPDVPNFAGQVIVSLMDVIKNSPFKSSLNRIMK